VSEKQGIKALIFDVFGTVVDWRTSIVNECQELGNVKNIQIDWNLFADRWRGKYGPFMDKVRSGSIPWTNLDSLHRMALDELLTEFDVTNLSEGEKQNLNKVWHRLTPWPDAIPGLTKLKSNFIIGTLSNGNISLLVNMAKNAGLPWDCIFSAELARAYKPDPIVYKTAVSLLEKDPSEILMVAAHKGDLTAAQKVGLRTAYIPRPLEYGPNHLIDTDTNNTFDIDASDINDLAVKLEN
jgi:2-haloacid dehalogenase